MLIQRNGLIVNVYDSTFDAEPVAVLQFDTAQEAEEGLARVKAKLHEAINEEVSNGDSER